jgi:hypothetical protein
MSLWDKLKEWIDKDRKQLTYVQTGTLHKESEGSILPRSLQAGTHYVRLRLANIYLKKETGWFKDWYPAVYSVVRFNLGDRTIEVPNIADAARVGMVKTSRGDLIARNFILTPTVPFNGGSLSLCVGLFALQEQNHPAKFLKALGKFTAKLNNVPQLSRSLHIAQHLALRMRELFGPESARMHLGLHDSFSEGELKDGYIAAIRTPRKQLDMNELWVVDDELHRGKSLEEARAVPFEESDYMLFRVELFDKRDDWESLTSIQEPFQNALEALQNQSSRKQAPQHMRAALLEATQSPDLTSVDKRRVVERLIETYREMEVNLELSGAVGEEVPTLKRVMRAPMSLKTARGKGKPTVSEIFNVFPETVPITLDDRYLTLEDDLRKEALVDEIIKVRDEPLAGISVKSQKPLAPAFYFALKGDDVSGDQVKFGAKFDLTFNYGIPELDALAKMFGEYLTELLEGEKAELGIIIIPKGLTFTDGKWFQTARFRNGAIEEEVVFHLQASSTPVEEAGLHVIFDRNGSVLYEFPIPLQLVAAVDKTAPATEHEPPELNLDEIMAAGDRQKRTAVLHIFADGDKLSINYDNLSDDDAFQVEPKLVTRTSLADILAETKDSLNAVPTHPVWSNLEDTLSTPDAGSNNEKGFRECLEGVASAGWILYKNLAQDTEFKRVLDAINQLPPGSSLSIRTNCAFLPWEILYPSEYILKFKDKYQLQPQNLWGNRLLIECLLSGDNRKYKTPTTLHETSPAYASLNLFRTIDKDFAGKKFLPGKSHEDLNAELEQHGVKSEVRSKGSDILPIFDTEDYEATLIYFFCHGQNDKALDPKVREKLQIDETEFITADDLPLGVKYPRGPIIFLNSCSSGSFSPLSFSNFLSTFREKQALGLISTTFPVPIPFGAAFGQELLRRYFEKEHGKTIGELLLDFRRELLTKGNPLGLFYSLQCPMDIKALVK